jgi:photosystem II stability/assembly factor-like uncharacterized protein
MSRQRLASLALCFLVASATFAKPAPKTAPAPGAPKLDPAALESMTWREVGPYRGGRSAAATGVEGKPNLYYMGSTGGGVWKTEDGGGRWASISDGFFGGSIGAVEVSAWDNNVIYVGTGEKTVRGNVSHGNGVWKSVDAGKTWKHVGLADSRHIPRVRVHPKDPNLVYVAALGHLFGPNEERGVFRSKDGGETWQKIKYVSDKAGAVDLAMDPNNPRVLYASFWRVLRTPYSLESGGEGSSLFKTTDGGDTWTELTGKKGMPKGTLGIMGVTVSPSNSQNVYAIVEAEEGGVFRSKDGGETWTRVNEQRDLRQRAWYYSRIYADPADEESLYVLNVQFFRSKDGGKTFTKIDSEHGDHHDLWIDPQNPRRMILADDGGAVVSTNGGETWSTQANQPTSQMYRISTDNAFPYRLLGGQQDNSSVRIRSRSFSGGAIGALDWSASAGCESGYVVAKPDDPDLVFGGCYAGQLELVNHRTGESRDVSVWPDDSIGWGAAELKYRFQWNAPTFFSPHDPNRVYTAANVLFKSDDLGESWQPISPDLTRDDKSKQGPSGGPITKDNTSVETYCTIFAALESPHEKDVLWAGTDDGRLHLTRDGGGGWTEVTPKDLPEWSMINALEAHPFEKGGLYFAATRYKLDDFQPLLYRTADYGKTWTKIVDGIDKQHFTRVVRADPDRRGLLYAGTENGLYLSLDDGKNWQAFQRNLPIVPVTDLAIKERDLIAATQGRGYWILDDLSPLHAMPEKLEAPFLFAPRASRRLHAGTFGFRNPGAAGKNPPYGVVFNYFLPAEPAEDQTLSLEILDAQGAVIRGFSRKKPEGKKEEKKEEPIKDDDRLLEAKKGANRFVWDFGYAASESFPGRVTWNDAPRPLAAPGSYKARFKVGDGAPQEVKFEILGDPRGEVSQADFEAQRDFLLRGRDKVTEIHRELRRVRQVRSQLEGLDSRLGEGPAVEEIKADRKKLLEKMEASEKYLYQTQNRSPQDPLNFPVRANDKLGGVLGKAAQGHNRPTRAHYAVYDSLVAGIDVELAKLRELWKTDLPGLNQKIQAAAIPAIVPEKD